MLAQALNNARYKLPNGNVAFALLGHPKPKKHTMPTRDPDLGIKKSPLLTIAIIQATKPILLPLSQEKIKRYFNLCRLM